eukprot:TRINITY_DN5046_c0_g1_i1.p1 TRINITY_DN5046_c0_g1~~TRINITY_DN5046_c0_g1_i1.p1  ORF type:complete len:609 (-),score=200.72 TRINITY_DN5046_c0_g1_i1:58-1884(-)
MEEVDRIILINLNELLGLEKEEEIESLGQVKGDHIYKLCLKYVYSLPEKPSEEFPSSLPRSMSQRVSATSELANLIKKQGYKGDLSYHQILYPSGDSRKLIMWLIDSMPKKEMSSEGERGTESGIEEMIKKELKELLQEGWTPQFASRSRKHGQNTNSFHLSALDLTFAVKGRKLNQFPGLEDYFRDQLPFLSLQVPFYPQFAPSVFQYNLSIQSDIKERESEWNTKGLESGSSNPIVYNKKKAETISKTMKSILKNKLINLRESGKMDDLLHSQKRHLEGAIIRQNRFTTEEEVDMNEVGRLSEEELQKKREAELEALQLKLSQIQSTNSELSSVIKSTMASIRQIEASIYDEDLSTEKLEKEYRIKKRTYDLLPNADENIQKLQQICGESSSKLLELASKWEEIRIPLYEEYRRLRAQQVNSKEEAKVKLAKIKEMRGIMKELAEEILGKDEKYRELIEVYNSLATQVTRSTYTNRILDIVKNVKKQKMDIDKILIDTRSIQKEINSITATLNRTFSSTEDLIFADTKKDNTTKEIFREVVNLNENFKKLLTFVEEIGQTRNAILTLDSKTEQLQERISSLNFDRLEQDLKEIKAENRAIMEKLVL